MQPEIVAIQRELQSLRHEVRRQRRRAWLLPLIVALALFPLAVGAANPFTDLNPGSPHNGNIDLIYNAGVTTGCVPNQQYCPNGNVTREEMASFLARLGGLGANVPVVNAKTAQTAQNALSLGGVTSSQYLLKTDQVDYAVNASTASTAQSAASLQGFPANGLVRTNLASGAAFNALSITPQTLATTGVAVPGPGFVLVQGQGTFYVNTVAANALASVRLRDVQGNVASSPLYSVIGTTAGAAFEQAMSPVWEFQVTSAGDRSFVIEALIDPSSSGGVSVADVGLVALYVPFGPGGVQAAGAIPALPADQWPAHP